MSQNDTKEIYAKVYQAVYEQWDPIGISSYTNEKGEYDGYIPALCDLLGKDSSREQIFGYLWEVETESIGLSGNRKATEYFADWLYSLVH